VIRQLIPAGLLFGTGAGVAIGNRQLVDKYNRRSAPKSFKDLRNQYKDTKPGDVILIRDSHMRGPSHTALVSSKGVVSEVLVPSQHKSVARNVPLEKFLRDRSRSGGRYSQDAAAKISDVFRPQAVDARKLKSLSNAAIDKAKRGMVKYDPLANISHGTAIVGDKDIKATCVSFTDALLRESGAKRRKNKTPVLPRSAVVGLDKVTNLDRRESYIAPLSAMTAASGAIALASKRMKLGLPLLAAGIAGNAIPTARDSDNYLVSAATRGVGSSLRKVFRGKNKEYDNAIGAGLLALPTSLGIAKLLKLR